MYVHIIGRIIYGYIIFLDLNARGRCLVETSLSGSHVQFQSILVDKKKSLSTRDKSVQWAMHAYIQGNIPQMRAYFLGII